MKTIKSIVILISLILIPISTFALAKLAGEDQSNVEQTVSNFVKSVDNRNTSELQKTLFNDGSFLTYNTFTNKVEHYTASQFINLVNSGQKGGWERKVDFNSVDVNGNTALAKIAITDSRIKETGFVSLIKENGTWKIASDVSTIGLNK